MADVVKVFCIALPDGTNLWVKRDTEYVEACLSRWRGGLPKETLEEYKAAGVSSGCVELTMLRRDFDRIPTTNQFNWPEIKK